MTFEVIDCSDVCKWRAVLNHFRHVDVCYLPEYHQAYNTRVENARSCLWHYSDQGKHFAYAFILAPVVVRNDKEKVETGFFDISSTYGYAGPIVSDPSADFVQKSWQFFSEWASEQNIIAEFVRYSVYAQSHRYAHPETEIEANRFVAVSHLPSDADQMFESLRSKTRNMIRKAHRSDLKARELSFDESLTAFRELYETTMERNEAPGFFLYNDAYYALLGQLSAEEARLFGVFHEEKLVAASIALIHQKNALYHLGASLNQYSNMGAGNLLMFEMSVALLRSGVEFLNVGGGRTTADDDPLLRFKKNNAQDLVQYYIGKRVLDPDGYERIRQLWSELNGTAVPAERLIFYR